MVKLIFDCVHGGHLEFMQIVEVAQRCLSGNQARFVLEHIFITNQHKTSLYSTFLGSENLKWTRTGVYGFDFQDAGELWTDMTVICVVTSRLGSVKGTVSMC